MNVLKFKFIFILLMMISISSCDDEPLEGFDNAQNEEEDPNLDAIFQATLSDTIDFNADEITAELTEDGLQFSGTMNNKRIGFGLPIPAIGEKDLSTNQANGFYNTDVEEALSAFFTAETGVLNIETLDTVNTRISGTFSGEFVEISSNDTLNVTNGSFTDIFFEDNTPNQGGPDDGGNEVSGSLSVDIDGEATTFDLDDINFPSNNDVVVYKFLNLNEDDTQASQQVDLVLPVDLSEGDFDVNAHPEPGSALNPFSFKFDDPVQELNVLSLANSGQFSITNVSDVTIEGTFSLDGEDIDTDQTLSFTNGSFTINLQ